ncbi:MAG: hypothetical protein MPJ24_11615, partial [Pirellulaceae bacterium]|nr:hypothetical protein [Pirellulaceae bacterium]
MQDEYDFIGPPVPSSLDMMLFFGVKEDQEGDKDVSGFTTTRGDLRLLFSYSVPMDFVQTKLYYKNNLILTIVR